MSSPFFRHPSNIPSAEAFSFTAPTKKPNTNSCFLSPFELKKKADEAKYPKLSWFDVKHGLGLAGQSDCETKASDTMSLSTSRNEKEIPL